ncbi:MAG: PLD nuclease N-terminal domain-containing protein [Actinomycetota bacterium]
MNEWLIVFPFALVSLAGLIFWVWALVDAIGVSDDSLYRTGSKLLWVLVIVFTGAIGAIIYLAIGRPERGAQPRATSTPPAPPGSLPPPPG